MRLAALVQGAVAPVLHRRGLATSAILTGWAEIVGAHLAEHTAPLEIRWPRRPEDRAAEAGRAVAAPARGRAARAERAVLVIRSSSAFALEVQMAERAILEAANSRLGYAALGGIEIRQGPHRARRKPERPAPPPAALVREAEAGLADIADPALRGALARLGAVVKTRQG